MHFLKRYLLSWWKTKGDVPQSADSCNFHAGDRHFNPHLRSPGSLLGESDDFDRKALSTATSRT